MEAQLGLGATCHAMKATMNTWTIGLTKLKTRETPGSIYRRFENDLGYINTHLCIADAALRDFAASSRSTPDFVRNRVRANGHGRLNVGVLTIDAMLELSYSSHIALLLGRVASLCSSLRQHPLVNRSLSQHAQGDYVRRALWVVVQSQGEKPIPTPIEDALIHTYLAQGVLSEFDRLREARNAQLHAVLSNRSSPTRFGEVLASSKVSQQLCRRLCRALSGPPSAIAGALEKRFGGLKSSRRRNAARAAAEQEYLLDSADVEGILSDLAW